MRRELESYTIDTLSFQNVLRFEFTEFQHNLLPERIYFAPRVGLIRKELFNGSTWSIKQYHINN